MLNIHKDELIKQYNININNNKVKDREILLQSISNKRKHNNNIYLQAKQQYIKDRDTINTTSLLKVLNDNNNSLNTDNTDSNTIYEYTTREISLILGLTHYQVQTILMSASKKIKCILEQQEIYVDIEITRDNISCF